MTYMDSLMSSSQYLYKVGTINIPHLMARATEA